MRPFPDRILACAVLASAFAGCADARDPPLSIATWREDVGPLLADRCVRCHGPDAPAAGYALDSYLGALGLGTDSVPNAIAGDPGSLLLTKLSEPAHRAYLGEGASGEDALALMTRWVVQDRVAYFRSVVHVPGFVNPSDAQFHGKAIAAADYDMTLCRGCHGADYAGGQFKVSCLTCHPHTPEACNTCHGAGLPGDPPPAIRPGGAGAHAAHLAGSASFAPLGCDACHAVPARFDSPGHLHTNGKAEVAFGPAASHRDARPSYDSTNGTCGGVACHGAGLDGGSYQTRTWKDPATPERCDGCHGAPPAKTSTGAAHPQVATCEVCHVDTAGPGMTIKNPALHGDGIVQVRPGAAGCDGCHSGPGGTLPFRDTRGQTDQALVSVGAHTAHLSAGFFAAGFSCIDCHAGRTAADSPGHLDGTVQVAFGGLAAARSSTPSWDADTRTCAGVACHGSGLDGGSKPVSPTWTEGMPPVCGDCHGMPPAKLHDGSPHPPAATCGSCHGQVIDDSFQWVDRSLHIDGKVEVTTP